MKKSSMFEKYPDVVEVDDLRKMLGGISRRLAYRLLAEQEIRCVKVGRAYKIPKVCVIEYLMGEDAPHAGGSCGRGHENLFCLPAVR